MLVLIFLSFLSCKTYKDVVVVNNRVVEESSNYNKQNYREYKEQEIKYYQYVLKNNGEKFDNNVDTITGLIDKVKENDAVTIDETLLKKEEDPRDAHKQELIEILENKGIKPPKFIRKTIDKEVCSDSVNTEIKKDSLVEDANQNNGRGLFKNRTKEERIWIWQGITKVVMSIGFIILGILNPYLFSIVFPTSLALFACICYPFWWKRGYLDTRFVKIAAFIAAYGGLFANILWIILYV